jgi:cytochrome c oxidase accessory protein FixG
MAFVTALILFDFGWFREQFCVIACPYGRFQSLLMDESSRIVTYDTARGEPRRGSPEAVAGKVGDCVNCFRCVQVCPTGIDIRRGLQLECIACTACIDACDDVMTRLKKPTGLIRHDSALGLAGKKPRHLRPRTLVYAALIAVMAGGLILSLVTRTPMTVDFVRAADTPYSQITGPGGEALILNRFHADLRNQRFDDAVVRVRPVGLGGVSPRDIEIVSAQLPRTLKAGEKLRLDLFIKFPKSLLTFGKTRIKLEVLAEGTTAVQAAEEVTLVGPLL